MMNMILWLTQPFDWSHHSKHTPTHQSCLCNFVCESHLISVQNEMVVGLQILSIFIALEKRKFNSRVLFSTFILYWCIYMSVSIKKLRRITKSGWNSYNEKIKLNHLENEGERNKSLVMESPIFNYVLDV